MENLTPEIVKNKRVLMRVDFNVDIDETGKIIDDFRIQRTLPTIKCLQEDGAKKIVLISHLGQPEKEDFWTEKFSLKPVAEYLEILLKQKVYFIQDFIKQREKIENIEEGSIILLENIRFYLEEEKNDKDFARTLSQLGDLYINEAFSVSHREAASLCAITEFLPSYPGLLFQEEIAHLNLIKNKPQLPLVVILGGAKAQDKLPLIDNFITKASQILVGGVIANTILKSWHLEIGQSLYEKNVLEKAQALDTSKNNLILPGDFAILTKQQIKKIRDFDQIQSNDIILDIGLGTAKTFAKFIKQARTIFWNGPLGKIEDQRFQEGTKLILEAILSNTKAQSLIGGGDTLMSIKLLKPKYKIQNTKYKFFSTGGGAMMNYLAGQSMPGLKALKFYG
jgi:phosphoglycerate kinase